MMDAITINNRAKDKLMSIARLFSADEERRAIETEQSNFTWSAQKVIDTINGAKVGERDSLIFRAVCRMNPEDTSLVRCHFALALRLATPYGVPKSTTTRNGRCSTRK